MKSKMSVYVLCSLVGLILMETVPNNAAQATELVWYEDFESYSPGSFPSPPWYRSGNNPGAYIDNSVSYSGSQSMHLFGVIGGCWGVMILREIAIPPPFAIEFMVFNGSENIYGCHPQRGSLELKSGPNWWDCGAYLMDFQNDGRLRLGDSFGWHYNELEWIKVRVEYSRPNENTVHQRYYINDVLVHEMERAPGPCEDELSYVSLGAQEGTVWFDDVRVWQESPLPKKRIAGWISDFDYADGSDFFIANADVFTEISPVWYKLDPGGTGTFSERESITEADLLMNVARTSEVLVLPTIGQLDEGGVADVDQMLSNPEGILNHILLIRDTVNAKGYDGIDIDYEGFSFWLKPHFTNFVQALAETLHAYDKLLSVTVQPAYLLPNQYDYAAIADAADEMRVMCYDMNVWNVLCLGDARKIHSPTHVRALTACWSLERVHAWVSLLLRLNGVPLEKIVIGIPTYGYRFPGDGGNPYDQVAYDEAMENLTDLQRDLPHGGVPHYRYECGGTEYEIWFEDFFSFGYKMDFLLDRNISGFSIWRLGKRDDGIVQRIRDFSDGIYFDQEKTTLMALSPVDFIIYTPGGLEVSKETNEVPTIMYSEADVDGDDENDDIVVIYEPSPGPYTIGLVQDPAGVPGGVYTLFALQGGDTTLLALHEPVPPVGDTVWMSYAPLPAPSLTAVLDIDPDVLNLWSKGRWITAYIEVPDGYDVDDIDIASVHFNWSVPAESSHYQVADHDSNGVPDLMVKFDRVRAQDVLTPGDSIQVCVVGNIGDEMFEGRDAIRVIVGGGQSDDQAMNQIPVDFRMLQNYPNPFTSTTGISYNIPESFYITLTIYNASGQLVNILIDQVLGPGYYTTEWDRSDRFGKRVPSGIYFYRIQAGGFTSAKKMVVLR